MAPSTRTVPYPCPQIHIIWDDGESMVTGRGGRLTRCKYLKLYLTSSIMILLFGQRWPGSWPG